MSDQDETTRLQAIRDKPTQHWAVMVYRNGADILTIESNHLSGKPEFSDEDAQCIRDCARHLLAFIGGEDPASVLEAARQEIAKRDAARDRAFKAFARRASEGCEGPMDNPCFKTKIPLHLWCDPCRCQEAAKAIKAERATVDALRAALRGSQRVIHSLIDEDCGPDVAYCWWCHANINGYDGEPKQPHAFDCRWLTAQVALSQLAVLLDERGSR